MDAAEYNARIRANAVLVDMYHHADWVNELVTVPGALIAPQTTHTVVPFSAPHHHSTTRQIYNGGVYDAAGRIVPEGVHIGGAHRNVPDADPPAPEDRLTGRWLFGGQLRGHFGHFLVESLGRLWALEKEKVDGVIFFTFNGVPRAAGVFSPPMVAKRAKIVRNIKFVNDMLELMTRDVPVNCISQPTHVEELVIPSQLMGNINYGRLIAGHADYRQFVRNRVGHLQGSPPHRKIYISRSRLGYGRSKYLLEALFEKLLAADGYDIIYPEKMTVREQIATYLSSSKVIIATGSAVHLLALAAHDEMDVALMDREVKVAAKFDSQLNGMGVRSVHRIAAVDGIVRPVSKDDRVAIRWKILNAIFKLNLAEAWSQLSAAGFVSNAAIDLSDVAATEAAELDEIVAHFGGVPFEISRWKNVERRDLVVPGYEPQPNLSHIDFLKAGTETSGLISDAP